MAGNPARSSSAWNSTLLGLTGRKWLTGRDHLGNVRSSLNQKKWARKRIHWEHLLPLPRTEKFEPPTQNHYDAFFKMVWTATFPDCEVRRTSGNDFLLVGSKQSHGKRHPTSYLFAETNRKLVSLNFTRKWCHRGRQPQGTACANSALRYVSLTCFKIDLCGMQLKDAPGLNTLIYRV